MRAIFFALAEIIIASGILYLYYYLVLRNKKFHQYNRFYILIAFVISILIPLIQIPVNVEKNEIESSLVWQTLQTISVDRFDETSPATPATPAPAQASFDWNQILYFVYLAIALLIFIRVVISLRRIRAIIRNNESVELDGIRFINTSEPGTPFSFFSWLFWNRKIELKSEKGEQMFRHEIFHIRNKHSVDIVFTELITTILWINPFFHLMKKELKAIHEFLADQFASDKSEKWEYAELLLMQAFNTQQPLVNPFFHNQIKRRIAMIINPQNTSYRYLRKALALPVAALLLSLFAFKLNHRTDESSIKASKSITIVVDAGHGGIDPGAKSPNGEFTEAHIALEISRVMQNLAPEYNINVVMTREDDHLPGNASTIDEGLKKRIEISDQVKPTAFVSIHMNTQTDSKNNRSGFEAYINEESVASTRLASSVLESVGTLYKTQEQPETLAEKTVYILRRNKYPSMILQCGYISNPDDVAFLSTAEGREKLARKVLEGIVKFTHLDEFTSVTAYQDTIPPGKRDKKLASEYANALIVIDGVIYDNLKAVDLDHKIKPNEIATINVWKGNTAISLYGEKGKNGVIEIITKKAKSKSEVNRPGDRDERIIFEKVEIEPAFPGGAEAWKKYVEENLKKNVAAENNAPAGNYTVFIQFVVQRDGSIRDVKPLTKHGYGMEEEAIQLIKNSPRWLPAIQNGKKVNAYRKQPVNFKVTKGKNPTTMTQKWLNEIVMVGYVSSKPAEPTLHPENIQPPPQTQAGSLEWKKFFERNLDPGMPIGERWTKGIYKILVQFTQNEDGTLSDIKALVNRNSKTAQHCITVLKRVQRLLPQNGTAEKVIYIQPFIFQVVPDKSVSRLYKS